MTIKKTSNRSTVVAIEKDLAFIRVQHADHQKKLEGAQEQRLAAEKKQSDVTLEADTYNSEKAKKQIEELDGVVSASLTIERRARRNVEACRKRITDLEKSLTQAKVRQVKAEVRKFLEQLVREAPGLQKLFNNFSERLVGMLKSCGPIDGKIRDLGSDYYLKGDLEKALFGWVIAQNYHLNPNKFERPHRHADKDDSGIRPFLWDGELREVLEKQFEIVLNNPKLTAIEQPFISADGLEEVRVVPTKEKLMGEAEQMRRESVPA